MHSDKIAELTAQKNKQITDASLVLDAGDVVQYRSMLKEIEATQETIDMLTVIGTRLKSLPVPEATTTETRAEVATLTPEQRTARVNHAFLTWFKTGYDVKIPEHRALLSTSDGTGGAVIPQEIQTDFVSQALKAYAPLVEFARVRWSDDSAPVKIVSVDDRANGLTLISEGSGPSELDPTLSSSTVFYDQLSTGLVQFSNQLLQDSAFDLTTFLSDLTASRFGRGLERVVTKSVDFNGTATPNNVGIVNVANVATTTASLADGIGWTDVINLYDALDAAFLPKAVWQMSSKTRTVLLQQKDGTGRPFYVPAPTADGFDMLLGRPVVINQSLDLPTTANGRPIIFGSLYEGLEIVIRRLRVLTIRERWADLNLSAISTYTGVGSTALAPGALQALKLAAS